MLPGPAVPGCCLVSFYFLWAILCTQAVFDYLHILCVNLPTFTVATSFRKPRNVEMMRQNNARQLKELFIYFACRL